MPFLTLHINGVPIAESIFDLPERDKGITREVSHRINKLFIANKIAELKELHKSRISAAGSEYEIQFSLRSSMLQVKEIPDGSL